MYRVMLADDEPIMRKALQTLIDWKKMDCQVVYTAVNGNDVLEHLEDCAPDILVTDIQMPGKDGIALAKYVWEKKLPIRLILLTAFADFSYAQSAVKYKVVEYVTKTGAFGELIQAVEHCKVLLEESKKGIDPEAQKAKEENFFKGVFDGSIYGDIEQRFQALELELGRYRVLLFHFLLEKGLDQNRKQRMQEGLRNFFGMSFQAKMIQGLFLKKDLYCVILHSDDTDSEEWLKKVCCDIMDMTDNFMELYTYVGISRPYNQIELLWNAYAQALAALQHSAREDSEKIVFYTSVLDGEVVCQSNQNAKKSLAEECRQYIEKHYTENMSVSDVAKRLGTSASYLSRIFKEVTGDTVIQYMNQKKIEKAKEYLQTTDMKIYEIADAVGFENITYFSRFFKKHTGLSPKEFGEKGRR